MTTRFPKISIVTPSYNQGKYIEQTICSVLNQNYPNLEYIIIDGGSTDETVSIIKKYESKITYWVSEKDKGQTDAINKGFAQCSGEIFNWINSDDYYEPGALMALAEMYDKHPNADVFCGKEWGFNDDMPVQKVYHPGSIIENNVFETVRIGIIDQPCTFWKRKVIEQFFPLDISLRYVMDRQLWWAYLLKEGQSNIAVTDKVFTNFRLHPQSKSVNEGVYFDADFDRLKKSVFAQLSAPDILSRQLISPIEMPNIKWEININANHLLASFAFSYAIKNYVAENMQDSRELMMLVKEWKGKSMTRNEYKMWLLCCKIPANLLFSLKKLKKLLS